jgi:uncharacterized protein YejL (UPF0352 family)
MARKLERSLTAVARKLDTLPVESSAVEDNRVDYWKARAKELSREVAKLKESRTAVDVLVEQAVELAPSSYSTSPAIAQAPTKGVSSPQSAVLLLSDTHIGAVITPEQTLGFGEYNFDVFLHRLKRLENSVISVLSDHTTTDITELVVPVLGDMIDGALTHSAEVGQVNTLFSQFYSAGHALTQFFRNLSAFVPKVRVYTCVGNHPRWGTQKRMPTKNRYSNLDQFLYAYMAALLRDNTKIEFTINQQPFAEFKVQGFNFLAAHGDHLSGGDKALGIPSHSIGRNVSAGAQIRLKCNRPGINYYALGHFHRPMELPHSLGEIIVNGAFPGIDGFALTNSFVACDPVQKFFFIHPRHGRAASYTLNLKWAKTSGPTPYDIPEEFRAS